MPKGTKIGASKSMAHCTKIGKTWKQGIATLSRFN